MSRKKTNCRECLDRDKRRKTENVVAASGELLSDRDTFRVITDFMTIGDLDRLSLSSRTMHDRVDPFRIQRLQRRVWGIEVLNWPLERRDMVRRMLITWWPKLEPGLLPQNLTHLTFGPFFSSFIGRYVLPPNLTHLTLSPGFNQSIGRYVLPPSLTHLRFGDGFDQFIGQDVLPPSLTHLKFGERFNQPLTQGLVSNLPNLVHLEFGELFFDQPLGPGVLPPNLMHFKYMRFGSDFEDRPIGQDVLPPSLVSLHFNQPLTRDALSNLTSLTHLELEVDNQMVPTLSPHLKYLKLSLRSNQSLIRGMLPPSLTHLELYYKHPFARGTLSDLTKLTHLEVRGFNHPLTPGILPPNLTHLRFENDFRRSLIGVLPPSLTHLNLPYYAVDDHPLDQNVLSSLVQLIIDNQVHEIVFCTRRNRFIHYESTGENTTDTWDNPLFQFM